MSPHSPKTEKKRIQSNQRGQKNLTTALCFQFSCIATVRKRQSDLVGTKRQNLRLVLSIYGDENVSFLAPRRGATVVLFIQGSGTKANAHC